MPLTEPDRLFPAEPRLRDMARAFYGSVEDLPIISPHGHCEPRWFAENNRFPNPAELFVIPDHYVFRMLASRGVSLTDLGMPRADGGRTETDPRVIWRRFAENYHLFRGTPSAMWLDHSFEHLFGIDEVLSAETADSYYEHIDSALPGPISCHARGSSGSMSRCWPPPTPRRTSLTGTGSFATAAGQAAS